VPGTLCSCVIKTSGTHEANAHPLKETPHLGACVCLCFCARVCVCAHVCAQIECA